jgi:hypothetical protein
MRSCAVAARGASSPVTAVASAIAARRVLARRAVVFIVRMV